MFVHLPIGSPAFMFVFAQQASNLRTGVRFVFSHARREAIDEKQPDGSINRRAIFRFQKFIVI
jgi:hypothetical protein